MHLPLPEPLEQRPLGLPVHRTSTFAFATAEDYADVLGFRKPGYSYSRIENPTVVAFARAVAALEGHGVDGPVAADAFASGMAAIATVLLTFCRAGANVVAPRALYGGTYGVLTADLARFGVETRLVDGDDLGAVRAAVDADTAVLWAETLANPTMAVADLPALAGIARGSGVPLVVDSTFASPAVCRPLEHGVDLVVHSATKYISGHSDVTGGVVVGRPALVERVRGVRINVGGSLSPDDAFLLHRGLATLPLRVERQCASALAYAQALSGHPRVARVDYPGLPGHRDHELARRLFDSGPAGPRYGAVVTVTPAGGRPAGLQFCDGLRLATIATSLGGHHTVVSHAASTTHRQFDDAALAAAGIDPGAVRVSIGLEDAGDLIADAVHALDALG